MDHFTYRNRTLYCEGIPAADLAAQYGTPLYVYSAATMRHHLRQLQEAFAPASPLLCYSVKANGNVHLCRLMHKHGAGFDVTSAGELHRARLAGATGEQIVFAGAGKTDAELRLGLETGVRFFNVESEAELYALATVAASLDQVAPVALRVNPALPPKTHAKTDTSVKGTKFGLDIETVLDVAQSVVGSNYIRVVGLHMHLGSPILSAQPYRDAADKGIRLIAQLRAQGHPVEYWNMGGGFGIHYRRQEALPASAFAEAVLPAIRETGCQLVLEPGRFIVGNAGVLLTRVIYTKESGGKRFVIQDGGMNDLVRPTLYDSFHRIWPAQVADGLPCPPDDYEAAMQGTRPADVVGPVCESGDFLAKDRRLPDGLRRGDLLAVFSAGAYGMSMASNYNSRPRPAEVLVDGDGHRCIRRRETVDDLVALELAAGPLDV